jgi:hypothetical protein
VWQVQQNCWGCEQCRQLLPPTPPPIHAPLQHAQPLAPTCTRCGVFATFYPQTNQWGCDRCRAPVDPRPPRGGIKASTMIVAIVIAILVSILAAAINIAIGAA